MKLLEVHLSGLFIFGSVSFYSLLLFVRLIHRFACQRIFKNGLHGYVRFSKTLENACLIIPFGVRMKSQLTTEILDQNKLNERING